VLWFSCCGNLDRMSNETTAQDPRGLREKLVFAEWHGERTHCGSGRFIGNEALITSADTGVGCAVAIAFAREGPDAAVSYLPEEQQDANETLRWVNEAKGKSPFMPEDIRTQDRVCYQLDLGPARRQEAAVRSVSQQS
jgi:hypothetical protein